MINSANETEVSSTTQNILELNEPKRFYVVMHNDNETPFDFVIKVLVDLYHHDPQTSEDLANKIHIEQKAIVGMYNLEIAEQKVEETIRVSRGSGYPLTVSLEQAD